MCICTNAMISHAQQNGGHWPRCFTHKLRFTFLYSKKTRSMYMRKVYSTYINSVFPFLQFGFKLSVETYILSSSQKLWVYQSLVNVSKKHILNICFKFMKPKLRVFKSFQRNLDFFSHPDGLIDVHRLTSLSILAFFLF